ncbi:MAG: hypothetical protein HRU76_04680 [Phycisphaeraceae bacterium]|nr:hypothetical protein [Phycisphaerales bacterium]QOJ16924.1 MAG: hypothetical protein HRU76_04680 [Phycisphaeraceae bacterium]
MSRSGRRKTHTHDPGGGPSKPRRRTPADLGSYVAFFLIWVFASGLFYIVANENAPVLSTGLLAVFAWYVVVLCVQAHRGVALAKWQRSLVRLPLITVGGGKQLVDSIKRTDRGRHTVLVSVLAASVATVLLVLLIARGM